ncbi:ATP-NAD kinase-like domain-containing protein [Spinellus fusiger]|nr:ATP-NAD kinase-like domain-containing protein [Spinellus fusiger]
MSKSAKNESCLSSDVYANPPSSQHRHTQASHLSDTAEVVREVAKKMGKTRITWENPQSVLIITKPNDNGLVKMTCELADWLIETPRYGQPSGITVKLKGCRTFDTDSLSMHNKLRFWTPELISSQPKLFDFIVTLGGDGTVLFASWLFQDFIPPIIPFHLGSLGFLTPFHFEKYDAYLTHAMEKGVRINLRGRLSCTVYRRVNHAHPHIPNLRQIKRNLVTGKITVGEWCTPRKKLLKKFGEVDGEDYEDTNEHASQTIKDIDTTETDYRSIPCFTTIPVEKYHVLNDLVIDRGPSPYMSLLELFGDDKHLTTVQADGLAISTPTGSTAYSLSAGGSMTHPEIRATLITPICPHTLSFRPTLVPDSMELRICVPYNSRNTAWVSFDGRGRVELRQGDHIKVTASKYPFPTVCKNDQATDWFNSLSECLHWNKRQRQKSFAIVESHRSTKPPPTTFLGRSGRTPPKTPTSPSSPRRTPHPMVATDMNHDEVFAIFGDEDGLRSSGSSTTGSITDDALSDQEAEDTLHGWTDEEILRGRYKSTAIKDMGDSSAIEADEVNNIIVLGE